MLDYSEHVCCGHCGLGVFRRYWLNLWNESEGSQPSTSSSQLNPESTILNIFLYALLGPGKNPLELPPKPVVLNPLTLCRIVLMCFLTSFRRCVCKYDDYFEISGGLLQTFLLLLLLRTGAAAPSNTPLPTPWSLSCRLICGQLLWLRGTGTNAAPQHQCACFTWGSCTAQLAQSVWVYTFFTVPLWTFEAAFEQIECCSKEWCGDRQIVGGGYRR